MELGVVPSHQKSADFISYLRMTRSRAALYVRAHQKRLLLRKSSFSISFFILIKGVYDNLRRIVIRSSLSDIRLIPDRPEGEVFGGMTQILYGK